eukprot:354043-Chlamydomonas_euryale.AAC.3
MTCLPRAAKAGRSWSALSGALGGSRRAWKRSASSGPFSRSPGVSTCGRGDGGVMEEFKTRNLFMDRG